MKIFVLEDNEERNKLFTEWGVNKSLTITNSAIDGVEILKHIKFDYIFLDHDLGGKAWVDSEEVENTGMYLAKRLNETKNAKTTVFIHSMNEPAGRRMMSILDERGNHTSSYKMFFTEEFFSKLRQIDFETQMEDVRDDT